MFISERLTVFGFILITTELVNSINGNALSHNNHMKKKQDFLNWIDNVYKQVIDEDLFELNNAVSRQTEQSYKPNIARRKTVRKYEDRRSIEKEDPINLPKVIDPKLPTVEIPMNLPEEVDPNFPTVDQQKHLPAEIDPNIPTVIDPSWPKSPTIVNSIIPTTMEDLQEQITNVRDVVEAAITLMNILKSRFDPLMDNGINHGPDDNKTACSDESPSKPTEKTPANHNPSSVANEPGSAVGNESVSEDGPPSDTVNQKPVQKVLVTTENPKDENKDLAFADDEGSPEISSEEVITKSKDSQMTKIDVPTNSKEDLQNKSRRYQNKLRRLQEIMDNGNQYLQLLESEKKVRAKKQNARRTSKRRDTAPLIRSQMFNDLSNLSRRNLLQRNNIQNNQVHKKQTKKSKNTN